MALSETEERGELRQMNERLGRVEDQLGDLRREMHGGLNKVRDDLNKLGWKIAAAVVVAVLVNQLLPLLTR